VQEIVKRASELEVTTPTGSGAMTIGGVEALAAEVGIAPDTVRAAAASLRRQAACRSPRFSLPSGRTPGSESDADRGRAHCRRRGPESEYSVMVEETRRMLQNVGQ